MRNVFAAGIISACIGGGLVLGDHCEAKNLTHTTKQKTGEILEKWYCKKIHRRGPTGDYAEIEWIDSYTKNIKWIHSKDTWESCTPFITFKGQDVVITQTGKKIPGANSRHFEILVGHRGGVDFYKDQRHVWNWKFQEIKNVNVLNFRKAGFLSCKENYYTDWKYFFDGYGQKIAKPKKLDEIDCD